MKVLMVSPYSWDVPGGVNRHVEGLSRALEKRGHQVHIMAPDGVRGEGYIPAGRSIPIPFNRSVARVAVGPRALAAVLSAASSVYDLAHLHEPLVPGPSLFSLILLRCPLVATFHAAREEGSRAYALGRGVFQRLLGRLRARIAVSPAALAFVSKYFPGEYRLIPNGVDRGRFFPLGEDLGEGPALPGVGLVYLFVGRNEPRKGLPVALEAFRRLRPRRPWDRLLVAGTAGLSPEPGVVTLGVVEESKLADVYRSAHVLLAPALGGESFGMVLLEAMACGTPVIASDIPGYRYVLEGGRGGVLVPPGDADALAEAMLKLAEDPARRKALSEEALRRAAEFSWDRVALRVEEVYREVVAEGLGGVAEGVG
jgi:phosphatidylinositol alpha-mannosyltransferase